MQKHMVMAVEEGLIKPTKPSFSLATGMKTVKFRLTQSLAIASLHR